MQQNERICDVVYAKCTGLRLDKKQKLDRFRLDMPVGHNLQLVIIDAYQLLLLCTYIICNVQNIVSGYVC